MISGYERNVEEARQAIQQLVAELQEMVSLDVHLDPRTHARIIGARGKAIRKLMEEFKVDGINLDGHTAECLISPSGSHPLRQL